MVTNKVTYTKIEDMGRVLDKYVVAVFIQHKANVAIMEEVCKILEETSIVREESSDTINYH